LATVSSTAEREWIWNAIRDLIPDVKFIKRQQKPEWANNICILFIGLTAVRRETKKHLINFYFYSIKSPAVKIYIN
jgi:hypothetical protein